MQILTCNVSLGGDEGMIVARGVDRPVTYPELLILAEIHGGDSVREIKMIEDRDVDSADERERLKLTYGAAVVDRLFPGGYAELPAGDRRIQAAYEQAQAKAAALAAEAAQAEAQADAEADAEAEG